MPYGKDFLDAVNDMLMDDGKASKTIKMNCEVCNEPALLSEMMLESPLKFRKMCSACAKAGL